MANWQHTLDLKDLWILWKADDINKRPTIQKMGKHVAKRIKRLSCYEKYMLILKEIADKFELVSDVEDFDDCLHDLYEWGDTPLITPKGEMQRKICWIKTNF